ncbi:MAG: efflux RND transporter permease subunit [Phycisphaerales bacterium]|nr:efflux RND transporter permease subunit [Phycisphaerales bacterium]
MSLASFGVRKHVVANLVMFAIIFAGLAFGTTLKREFFPYVAPRMVSIIAPYPGAAPEEIEDSLGIKIEDAVADLTGIKEITTTISEGVASLQVEFIEGTDIDQAVTNVKREIDALQDLPDQVDNIIVDKIEAKLPAIIVALYGDADERTMKKFINATRDDLLSLPGVTDISTGGVRTDEILVEVNPARAIEHGLSLPRISDLIGDAMIELPGGSVRTNTSTISVRSVGIEERGDEILNIVLKASNNGGVIRLRDVASVHDGFVDIDLTSRYEGHPTTNLTVFRVGKQDIIGLSALVKAYVAGRNGEPITLTWKEKLAPPGSSPRAQAHELGAERFALSPPPGTLITTTDLSRFVSGRLNLLLRNAFYGGILVFLTLVILLNWRISFWVAMGLAVSLLGTLAMMAWLDVSLNLLTMFGLIIVIGILVDDAIVVAENIATKHESGMNAYEAAIAGTDQVAWPVVSTVLTTICAFLPLALLNGMIGDFMSVLPIVVGCALAVSLIESLFILPSHMAMSLRGVDKKHESGKKIGRLQRFEERYDNARDHIINGKIIPAYANLLSLSMRFRYISLSIVIAAFIFSIGLVASDRVPRIFFEDDDAETVNITIAMPIGTPVTRTDEIVRRFEAICMEQPEIQTTFAQAGAIGDLDGAGGDSSAPHIGQLILELYPAEQRQVSSSVLIERIRKLAGPVPDAKSIRMAGMSGGPSGTDLNYTVASEHPHLIDEAVAIIKHSMGEFEAVYGISDDLDRGLQEVRFTLRDGAAEMGFTRANLGRQIQGMVFGLEAFTFAGDREDVDVRVTLPKATRRSINAIENQYVFTPTGIAVPLGEIALIEESQSYATIRRINRQRAVSIQADVNRSLGNPDKLAREIKPIIVEHLKDMHGVDLIERGRQKDFKDSMSSLPIGMLVSSGLIYVILAWLFGSFTQPLIVMAAIPFAVVGMIWGHMILGYSITFLSMIGFVALAGIVVNDSLIFMEFFNAKRREGMSVFEAGHITGQARFRAIMLTTITTVLGLLPMMLEQSFQAQFLIPMAITIACGLISATVIILIVLPCLLMILDDIVHLIRVLWTGRADIPRRNPSIESPEIAALNASTAPLASSPVGNE